MAEFRYLGDEASGANLSVCGRFRYELWRSWSPGLPVAVFVMLNPSTADSTRDDPTIRKCVGFAKRWNCGAIFVVNLFAYRATYPKDLLLHDPVMIVGRLNNATVENALRKLSAPNATHSLVPGPCVVAWGSQSNKRISNLIHRRSAKVRKIASELGVELKCLGVAKNGNPRHPLMMPYTAELQPWDEQA